jgi:epoxyqueuosine reductase
MSPAQIKSWLTHEARALGLSEVRVTTAHPATHSDEYRRWVAEGEHGDMAWMARNTDRRTDPQLVLPGAQSMIVVALNYYQGPRPTPPDQAARGVIARYAWGDDYHDVLTPRLHQLAKALEQWGGQQKVYVDTGPVLERDFASDAGLGWNGKSTVQIHLHLGAWFFLGEIMTTLALPPDPPFGDHCGRCTRCLDACPTQAITAPRHVDARRCISYLTIEHKGSIPHEFRRAIGDRLYGCDDCLSVCPWNRFAQVSQEISFSAREYVAKWPLRDFLTLDDEGFRSLFKKSPIKRIKRPAFMRNVCVVLGNIGTADDLTALRGADQDPHPLIAEHAQWAITEIEARLSSL